MRRFLKVAALTLALVVGGLVYAYKVSGLELPVPGGVDVILVEEPVGDAPPAAAGTLMDTLTGLAEENLDDFGYPAYADGRVVVNVASDTGERLFEQVDVPDGVPVLVRHEALSASECDRISTLLFEEVDAFHSSSCDAEHDRVVMTTRMVTPGLLRDVRRLVGPDVVAVRWAPLETPMRAV